jgi:hypothetical protein
MISPEDLIAIKEIACIAIADDRTREIIGCDTDLSDEYLSELYDKLKENLAE